MSFKCVLDFQVVSCIIIIIALFFQSCVVSFKCVLDFQVVLCIIIFCCYCCCICISSVNAQAGLYDMNFTLLYFNLVLVNPRRACARVTVLVVCVSVCLCVFPILAPRAIRRTNSSISDFSTIRA